MRTLTVLAPGPLTTVQDRGRPGQGALGIGRSGACDRAAAALANRLVGNAPDAAVLEATLGGLVLRADADLVVTTTGARCSAVHNAPLTLRAGRELRLGRPDAGLRTYVAVRGGVAVEPVLGSRSTDLLSGLGPPVLLAGAVLPVGSAAGPVPGVDVAPVPDPPGGEVTVRVLPGPRADWFADPAALTGTAWEVTGESNRIGLRLAGVPLERSRTGELPSEGMVRGALQVPPSGQPVLFLADPPVTGGYPVIGYVADDDVDCCGQLRPGQTLRFRAAAR
ncbi:biotin-dependent carboxyltransferase family protein [Geodermatophilus sp. DSM 44513]|uniref:5-oxoprolinase subunit C family protein n=1 Tax=Geodermatophilus sp. DSM 44513 TaxID=1528104 RepID=UPI001288ADF9|nr:biotin-dependent carboxyltransferase family protein [Geodermatophilus sp. DSM 44513]WNV73770.1 biotin-dependent carboxyltransferase family protein [Geodermatophilus sp. DSM 44513]